MLLINGGYRPEIIPGVSWHPMVGGIDIRGTLAIDFFKKGGNMTWFDFWQVDVADLYECGDVRKFLTIVAKSNLFR